MIKHYFSVVIIVFKIMNIEIIHQILQKKRTWEGNEYLK